MKLRLFTIICLTLVVAFASTSVEAQQRSQDRLLIITYDYDLDVRWVSGGFSEGARAGLQAIQDEFTVKLVFALTSDHMVGDVGVVAKQGGEIVLDVMSSGPILLADLPAGTYELTAVYEGVAKQATVTVGEGLVTEYMKWTPDEVNFEPMRTGE